MRPTSRSGATEVPGSASNAAGINVDPGAPSAPPNGSYAAAKADSKRSGSGSSWWLAPLVGLLLIRLLAVAYEELSKTPWWQDPAHRDLVGWVIIVVLAAGMAAALVWVSRRWVVPAVSGLFARWHWRWWRRQQTAHEVTPQPVAPEVEDRWIDHLVESFQRDVFYSYLGPGFASPNGKELPSVVAEVRSSGQSGARMSFACGRARSRLENRLRDLEQSWEFSPEALDRLEREVQASCQILLTCHTSIQSWQ